MHLPFLITLTLISTVIAFPAPQRQVDLVPRDGISDLINRMKILFKAKPTPITTAVQLPPMADPKLAPKSTKRPSKLDIMLAGYKITPGTLPDGTSTFGKYNILGVLGSGSFGTVYLRHDGEKYFALKLLSPALMSSDDIALANQEMAIQFKLKGVPNVVQIYEHIETKNGQGTVTMKGMVMEAANVGSFTDYLRGTFPNEREGKFFFKQMVKGLRDIHAKGIVHRDIKPGNILLFTISSWNPFKDGNFVAKYADFGLSDTGITGPTNVDTLKGSAYYIAPDLYDASEKHTSADLFKADVFALGLTLVDMLWKPHSGLKRTPVKPGPFSGFPSGPVDFKQLTTLSLSKMPGAYPLLQAMLATDPKDRPTPDEILKHAWLKGV